MTGGLAEATMPSHADGAIRRLDAEEPSADFAALLADLAHDAYIWARQLDSARERLPALPESPAVPSLAPPPDPRPAAASTGGEVIEDLLRSAEHDVLLVDPGVAAGQPPLALLIKPMIMAVQRGCTVRVLIGRPITAEYRRAAQSAATAGAEVRVGRTISTVILATDRGVALLPPLPITLITQSHLVRAVRELGDLAWSGALPWKCSEALGLGGGPLGRDLAGRRLHGEILTLLADGAKDEKIARVLGISVRTCRRHIADIMTELNAASRFQAGTIVARCGLEPVPGSEAAHPYPAAPGAAGHPAEL